LLDALYPSRNKQVVSPCQSLTSLTFVFNKAALAQCDNKGRLHRRKRDKRSQKWYAVSFLFVSVRLTTHYRNKSPLRHGRNYPTGRLPMFKHEHGCWRVFLRELPFTFIWCSASIQRLLPLPFPSFQEMGRACVPVAFLSWRGCRHTQSLSDPTNIPNSSATQRTFSIGNFPQLLQFQRTLFIECLHLHPS
jgi:hypothetical protein